MAGRSILLHLLYAKCTTAAACWWAQEAQSLVASAHSHPQKELATMVINETHQWPMDLPEVHQHRLERGKDSSIAHEAVKYLTERHEITLWKQTY